MPERFHVIYGPPAKVTFETELITDTAGHQQTGGSGASCWGFNQSNIVRHGEQVYAMSWRDDLTLVVFQRLGPGRWLTSPPLPQVPQNGNLLVDSLGRVHVIAGENAGFHAIFDPPEQVQAFNVQRSATADSRFGASINARDEILVAGGLSGINWYVLDPRNGYRPVASGSVPHEEARGYNFVVFDGFAAHTTCGDDYFIEGEQYPNQTVTWRDFRTGEMKTVETQRGIYMTLKSYYYYCPDVFKTPEDWRMTILSDVSDTWKDGVRGTTEQQDIMVDDQGRVHVVYYENRQPVGTVWASTGQDQSNSLLYHAVGDPGGPFTNFCLGNFTGGRLYQGPDGRLHYLLTRGRRGDAESLWYAVGGDDRWDFISEPIPLDTPTRFWHVFINTTRAGGARVPFIDCYWTGVYQKNSNEVWYGRLTHPRCV